MPTRARRDRGRISNLVDRVQHERTEAAERVGELVGLIAAPLFAATSTLRGARTFHPSGDCADAEVFVAPAVPAPYRALAERLGGNAFVRFSDALTRRRARWPDVLGCAIRFGGHVMDPAVHGDQDLLLATIRRPWTMPLSPFTTKVGDYLANDYFGVSPFSVSTSPAGDRGGVVERVWLRLRPEAREPGAIVTFASSAPISSLRTSAHEGRDHAAEQRRRRLERAIANGAAAFMLGVGHGPWGPFTPLVGIQLVAARLTDPPGFAFDPFRNGRGVEPQGFVHAMRRGAYGSSRRARGGDVER
jgi:hypothetical protein